MIILIRILSLWFSPRLIAGRECHRSSRDDSGSPYQVAALQYAGGRTSQDGFAKIRSLLVPLNPAEAAIAAGVFLQGRIELGFTKVRPKGWGNDQFGIGDLPEEEVAHAHLTAGAD